jgi:hypothetical protein
MNLFQIDTMCHVVFPPVAPHWHDVAPPWHQSCGFLSPVLRFGALWTQGSACAQLISSQSHICLHVLFNYAHWHVCVNGHWMTMMMIISTGHTSTLEMREINQATYFWFACRIHIQVLCLRLEPCLYGTNLHSNEAFLTLTTGSEMRYSVWEP